MDTKESEEFLVMRYTVEKATIQQRKLENRITLLHKELAYCKRKNKLFLVALIFCVVLILSWGVYLCI